MPRLALPKMLLLSWLPLHAMDSIRFYLQCGATSYCTRAKTQPAI